MEIRIRLEDVRAGYPGRERDLSVIPTVAHVDRSESVQWILEGKDAHSFVVFFQNETPVGQAEIHGRPAGTGETVKSGAIALKGAPPRVYRYAVAVATSTEIFLDAACPELILR
jgi:hypothetical protein